MKFDTTRRGEPAIWEEGGGMTSRGSATLVAGPHGEKLRPLFGPRGGHLACGQHAMFVARPGLLVVHADQWRDEKVEVFRIISIDKNADGGWDAATETVCSFSEGVWLPAEPQGAVAELCKAALRTAHSSHCRSVYWADLQR